MYIRNITTTFAVGAFIAPAAAFFRMSCPGRLVRERLDPIVSPGSVAGHVHTISGGSGFGPSMTFQQARASRCSSCTIKEDMSNYWSPQLYFQAQNGSFIPVPVIDDGDDINGGMTVYYLQRVGFQGEKLYGFPEGFRMVAGDTSKRNFTGGLDAKAVSFSCLGSNKDEANNLPNYNCPGGLRAQVFFPSCWDGVNLDSPNHKSHMSYFNGTEYNTGVCPSTHPVHTVSLFFEILYDTNRFKDQWYGDQQPFVFSNGDKTGYGFHGDFVNGWDVHVLQEAVNSCTSDSGLVERCPAVTQFTAAECKSCKIPAVIDEQTEDWTKTLPGCNPVTSGPAPADAVAACPVASIGSAVPNYVDMTSSKGWSYVGCGTDNSTSKRTLSGASTASSDMTVEKCVDFCSAQRFSYAGVEFGRECFCGNELNPGRGPQSGIYGTCNMKCAGNNRELCGGANALSIYHACTSSSCQNYLFDAQVSSSPTTTLIVSTTMATVSPRKPPSCPRNNCVNQIFAPSVSILASTFCATYTATVNTDFKAIPTYLNNCNGVPGYVSSACSCLMYVTPTQTGTVGSKRPRRGRW